MNDSSKIKILAALVIILVLINVSVLGYLWFVPKGPEARGQRDGRGPAGLVIRELKFDDQQTAQFEKLRGEHHAAMVEIDKASRELHKQLFKALADSADDSRKHMSDSLITEISKKEIARETNTFQHLSEVRKLCNLEQQKIFDDMIAKASMRRQQGPPPPRER